MNGRLVFAMTMAVLLEATAPGRASGADIYWSEREDRSEGLLRQHDVRGDTFALLGVQIDAPAPPPDCDRLRVWLPEPQPLTSLRVHERRINYAMEPLPALVASTGSFTWATSEVIRPAKVNLELLQVVAKDDAGLHYPVLLDRAGGATPAAFSYRFVFYSNAEVDVEWSIARNRDGLLDTVFEARSPSQTGRVVLRWDGRGKDGAPARAGTHQLDLKARTARNPSDPLKTTIRFVVYDNPE